MSSNNTRIFFFLFHPLIFFLFFFFFFISWLLLLLSLLLLLLLLQSTLFKVDTLGTSCKRPLCREHTWREIGHQWRRKRKQFLLKQSKFNARCYSCRCYSAQNWLLVIYSIQRITVYIFEITLIVWEKECNWRLLLLRKPYILEAILWLSPLRSIYHSVVKLQSAIIHHPPVLLQSLTKSFMQ